MELETALIDGNGLMVDVNTEGLYELIGKKAVGSKLTVSATVTDCFKVTVSFPTKLDIEQKIQEQLEQLLECEDDVLSELYIRRIRLLMEINSIEENHKLQEAIKPIRRPGCYCGEGDNEESLHAHIEICKKLMKASMAEIFQNIVDKNQQKAAIEALQALGTKETQ